MDPRNTKRGGSKPLFELNTPGGERFDDSSSDADEKEFQQSNDSSRILMTHADKTPDVKVSPFTKRVLLCIQGIIGILLFAIVLVCSLLSKLSLLSITDRLRQLTIANGSNSTAKAARNEAAGLYWQLFFVMVLPNCVTFVRSFVFGVFGKTRKSYPWPSRWALLGVSISIVLSFFTKCFIAQSSLTVLLMLIDSQESNF